MKKMKMLISVLLTFCILLSFAVPTTAAEQNAYPESEHNYSDSTTEEWTYKFPKKAEGLYVTFSEKTFVEYSDAYAVSSNEEITEDDIETFAEKGFFEKQGDVITITYGEDELYAKYQGTQLAGETIYIPGDSFKIKLETDDSVTGYGFSIDSISSVIPVEDAKVVYHLKGEKFTYPIEGDTHLVLNDYWQNYIEETSAIVGWQTRDGKKVYYMNNLSKERDFYDNYPQFDWDAYYNGDLKYSDYIEYRDKRDAELKKIYETDFLVEAGKTYDLYPIYCDVSIRPDEVFSFTNSDEYFDIDGLSYYYTNEHFYHQYIDSFATFALTPFAPAAVAVCAFETLYWPTFEFMGSCCGFPIAVLLQHYGKIDLLSKQNVSTVRELEPTPELISMINFYNNQATYAMPVNNLGIEPGTKEYTRQLKELFKTVESGKPTYFEYYGQSGHVIKKVLTLKLADIDMAHGVLLTGAYTDSDGNHILIGYNNNSDYYYGNYGDIYMIDKDFTTIYDDYGRVLNGFSFNSDISHFDSLKAEGVPNPFSWHISFIKHLFETFFKMIKYMFE